MQPTLNLRLQALHTSCSFSLLHAGVAVTPQFEQACTTHVQSTGIFEINPVLPQGLLLWA